MTRLQTQLARLYSATAIPAAGDSPGAFDLRDGDGRVRALVMEVTRPADWRVLGKVWHGVQEELELPAPAIAVSGTDGLQLWFSVAQALDADRAHGFVASLRARFLPDIDPARIRLWPGPGRPTGTGSGLRMVPARQEATGDWSAFVAPDLAPVFADTPWLDIDPGEEGQAALLSGLACIETQAFEAAAKRLAPVPGRTSEGPVQASDDGSGAARMPSTAPASEGPRPFLLRIMNDETVPLPLRIDAAKALLADAQPRDRTGSH